MFWSRKNGLYESVKGKSVLPGVKPFYPNHCFWLAVVITCYNSQYGELNWTSINQITISQCHSSSWSIIQKQWLGKIMKRKLSEPGLRGEVLTDYPFSQQCDKWLWPWTLRCLLVIGCISLPVELNHFSGHLGNPGRPLFQPNSTPFHCRGQ